MQKYLKITQEDFRKVCKISHRVQNSFSSALVSQALRNSSFTGLLSYSSLIGVLLIQSSDGSYQQNL